MLLNKIGKISNNYINPLDFTYFFDKYKDTKLK